MFKHAPWAHDEEKSLDKKAPSEEEESLTSVLDAQQRCDLTFLIASAAASMRRTIELNFDASVSHRRNWYDEHIPDKIRPRFLPG